MTFILRRLLFYFPLEPPVSTCWASRLGRGWNRPRHRLPFPFAVQKRLTGWLWQSEKCRLADKLNEMCCYWPRVLSPHLALFLGKAGTRHGRGQQRRQIPRQAVAVLSSYHQTRRHRLLIQSSNSDMTRNRARKVGITLPRMKLLTQRQGPLSLSGWHVNSSPVSGYAVFARNSIDAKRSGRNNA